MLPSVKESINGVLCFVYPTCAHKQLVVHMYIICVIIVPHGRLLSFGGCGPFTLYQTDHPPHISSVFQRGGHYPFQSHCVGRGKHTHVPSCAQYCCPCCLYHFGVPNSLIPRGRICCWYHHPPFFFLWFHTQWAKHVLAIIVVHLCQLMILCCYNDGGCRSREGRCHSFFLFPLHSMAVAN
jgi:hypothetical protein